MPYPIKHLVVLMLENRSFDHMLGYMPGVDGIPPNWSNPLQFEGPVVPAKLSSLRFTLRSAPADAGNAGDTLGALSFAHLRQDAGFGFNIRIMRVSYAQAYVAWGAGSGAYLGYNLVKHF